MQLAIAASRSLSLGFTIDISPSLYLKTRFGLDGLYLHLGRWFAGSISFRERYGWDTRITDRYTHRGHSRSWEGFLLGFYWVADIGTDLTDHD